MIQFPADRWLLIEDNLSIHSSRDVRLALLARPEMQVQFLPKYADMIEQYFKRLAEDRKEPR